jgi:hypothetical protein
MRDKEFQRILRKLPEHFSANRQERIERSLVSEDFHQIPLLRWYRLEPRIVTVAVHCAVRNRGGYGFIGTERKATNGQNFTSGSTPDLSNGRSGLRGRAFQAVGPGSRTSGDVAPHLGHRNAHEIDSVAPSPERGRS